MMGVSSRNIIVAGIAGVAITGFAYAGGMGGNGCNSGCGGINGAKGHGIVIPGASVGTPSVNQGTLGKGQQVVVPGVSVSGANVRVASPNIAVSGAGVAFGGQPSIVDTGLNVVEAPIQNFDNRQFLSTNGFFAEPNPVAPSAVDGLFVDGNVESYTDTVTEQVPTTQTTCINQGGFTTQLRPVQAFCIDDKGTPHPASRPSSDQQVDANFEGEIFRCVSGTTMQVVMGDRSNLAGGSTAFQNASGFSCAKGEALVHRRGGQLVCQTQIPQRNCNERSLLRRNGPGVKLVQTRGPAACVPTTTTVLQPVTRQVQRTRPAKTAPLVFDGGVGQTVY